MKKMNEKYLVSVIVPVYKVEKYLPKCVGSILAQTYSNLEVILVDDGSPDRSGEMCDEYASQDARVRVVHQENAGQATARNSGMDIATGDFILFVDSDDWIEPETVAVCIDEILAEEAKGIKVDVLYHSYNEVTEGHEGNYQKVPKWMDSKYVGQVYNSREFWLHYMEDMSSLHKSVWGKCFRKKAIDSLRFQEGIKGEDAVFMLELHAIVPSLITKVVANPLYNYRIVREGSTTNLSILSIWQGVLEGCYRVANSLQGEYQLYASTYLVNYFVDQYKYAISLRLTHYADGIDLFKEWLPRIRKMPLSREARGYRKLRLFQLSPWLYTMISRLKHRK